MTRVLVCGGRTWGNVPDDVPPELRAEYERKARAERLMLWRAPDTLHVDRRITLVIHGAAPGADHWGGVWARRMLILELAVPADWKTLGKRAGPIRNQLMLDAHAPQIVVASPGGKGTADMLRRARAARPAPLADHVFARLSRMRRPEIIRHIYLGGGRTIPVVVIRRAHLRRRH